MPNDPPLGPITDHPNDPDGPTRAGAIAMLEDLEGANEKLEEQLSEARDELSELEGQKDELEKAAAEDCINIDNLKARRDELKQALIDLEVELDISKEEYRLETEKKVYWERKAGERLDKLNTTKEEILKWKPK